MRLAASSPVVSARGSSFSEVFAEPQVFVLPKEVCGKAGPDAAKLNDPPVSALLAPKPPPKDICGGGAPEFIPPGPPGVPGRGRGLLLASLIFRDAS